MCFHIYIVQALWKAKQGKGKVPTIKDGFFFCFSRKQREEEEEEEEEEMAEVVVLVADDEFPALRHCRICLEEEEEEESLEAPCACSGTVKFAHRDCIQRWCDEKGNTTCEICLQVFKPGYTATWKKTNKKPPAVETTVTIRDSLQVPRREVDWEGDRLASDLGQAEAQAEAQAQTLQDDHRFSNPTTCAYRLRSLALTVTLILLFKHLVDVVKDGAKDYPFSLITIFMLGASGIIIPMYILVRTITALHNNIIKRYHHVSDEYQSPNELDEAEVAQQRHHTL